MSINQIFCVMCIAFFMIAAPFYAHANSGSTGVVINSESVDPFAGLTPNQIEQFKNNIQTMREQNGHQSSVKDDVFVSPETVNEWVYVGKNLGIAIAEVAGQVGKSADEFLESSVGKMAAAIIIYKVIGAELLSFIVGCLWFIFLMPTWFIVFRWMFNRFKGEEIEYFANSEKIKSRKIPEYSELGTDTQILFFWLLIFAAISMVAICGFGIGIMF